MAEHAYWGSVRDRLPLAQTDPLTPGAPPKVGGGGDRRLVGGQQNLCLIRSGQDWTDTEGDERRMYLEVTVASADEQDFEYLNCHPDTGLLRVLQA